MNDLLQTLAAYVPHRVVRDALAQTDPQLPAQAQVSRFPAAVLFADVSGFTPLTEALAQKGAEGPEELTRLLNQYFSRMIALVEREGGDVVKFSGDAVTVVFPASEADLGVATRRAMQAAQAMQDAMSDFATMETSVGPISLGMKIGIGAGEILSMCVGGTRDRWEYVIAGDPLRQVAEAEHGAERGEIILSPEAQALMADEAVPPQPLVHPDWQDVQKPAAVATVLRAYVPGVVLTWLEEGLQEWLAVLRPMSVLFISVAGIDYEQADAVAHLHAFMRATQEITDRYEGTVNKLAVDDKGTIMLILLGAPPRGHEDDPERALRCAMDLQAMAEAQGLTLAVGVTTGRVFAGPVGSQVRREYTVMGDTVNLAARLMAAAGKGQIRCGYETHRYARARLAFEHFAPVRVKGKAGLIRVYRPTGELTQKRARKDVGAFIGRQMELGKLTACLYEVQAGLSCIALVEGEAGIGKSRLVEELMHRVHERGLVTLTGEGRSIEQRTPYRAWRDIFTTFFDLADIQDTAARRQRVEMHMADIASDLAERLPLLNDVLNLGFPESDLTASMDTQLRHEALVSLLLRLLRVWAAERPLIIILEDAHWLDTLSWDLTVQVARTLSIAKVPLLLVVVMRPFQDEVMHVESNILADMSETERIVLGNLSPDETLVLAAARLGIARDNLPEAVAELVRSRAGGNPFFAEELIYALRDSHLIAIREEAGKAQCVVSGDLERVAQTLPDTIQGIVLSRIDRLPPEEQMTLKVAAVIGRTFVYTALRQTLGVHMEVSNRLLRTYLDDLTSLDLTPLEAPEPELTYIFKHIITQEVAYETLLFAQRRQLHRTVAQWYERTFKEGEEDVSMEEGGASPLAPYYPLLVYHWHHADDKARERHYAGLAAQWAAAQYANVEAVGYFTRALELTPESDWEARYTLLKGREAVNDLRGERESQAQDLVSLVLLSLAAEAQESPDQIAERTAEVALRLVNYKEVTSDYSAALIAARRAVDAAGRAQNRELEVESHIAWGNILWRRGDYEAAASPLAHALAQAKSLGHRYWEARSRHYLGHVSLYQEDYAQAETHYQEALAVYREAGYRQAEADILMVLGVIQYDLGDYSEARNFYEQALVVYQTTGDRRGETLIVNNLGVVYCDLGDYQTARDYHQQALDLRCAIADRWGEGVSRVNMGLVNYRLGEYDAAKKYSQQALELFREIGDRRGEAYSLSYLGDTWAALQNFSAALTAYKQAVLIRRDLGQPGMAMDGLAGIARVHLAQGDHEQALDTMEEILTWISAHGIESVEYPLEVYLTCYRVLQEAATPTPRERANSLLAEAYALLQKRAQSISDDRLRYSFLENVQAHREIVQAWKARDA